MSPCVSLGDEILIVGPSGAGRSTLARSLTERLSLPYSATSWIRWSTDPRFSGPTYLDRQVDAILNQAAWIMDGDHSDRQVELWRDADVILWLDYSFQHVLWRMTRRNLGWWISGTVIAGGQQMSLRQALRGILEAARSYGPTRQRIALRLREPERPRVMRFARPTDTLQWLGLLRQVEVVY